MASTFKRATQWQQKPTHGAEVDGSHPLAPFLRGFWLLTEGVGSVAGNIATPLNTGTLGGTVSPTWTTSQNGRGLNFTAGGEQVNLGRGAFLDDLPVETFEAMIYLRSLQSYAQRPIAKQDSGSTVHNTLLINADGTLNLIRSRATTATDYTTSTALSAGNWYHIAATFDTNNNVAAIYINGVESAYSAATNGSGALTSDAGNDLLLGNRPGNDRTFDGVMIYARVFNTYCTPALAQELYANPYGLLLNQQTQPIFSAASQFTQSLAGSLASGGAVTRRGGKGVGGSLTHSGALIKQGNKSLVGSFASAGALTRRGNKSLAGTLSGSGVATKQIGKGVAGTMNNAGGVARQTRKGMSGALSVSGVVSSVRTFLQTLAATLGSSGAVTRRTSLTKAGTLSNSGSVTKQTGKNVAGALNASGTLSSVKTFLKLLAASLGMSGGINKRTATTKTGALTASGGVSTVRTIVMALAASLGLSGAVGKRTTTTKTGTLGITGSVSGVRTIVMSLAATLGLSGAVTRRTSTTKSGVLNSTGSAGKQTRKGVSGALSAGGAVGTTRTIVIALAGALGLSGVLTKRTATTKTGSLTTSGGIVKRISRTLGGVLGALGDVIGTFIPGWRASVDLVMRDEPMFIMRDESPLRM